MNDKLHWAIGTAEACGNWAYSSTATPRPDEILFTPCLSFDEAKKYVQAHARREGVIGYILWNVCALDFPQRLPAPSPALDAPSGELLRVVGGFLVYAGGQRG